MAKSKPATPAVEATAGVTSNTEAVSTATDVKETSATPHVIITNEASEQLIKDLELKLEAAQKEIIILKNTLEKTQSDLEQSVKNHSETLVDLSTRNLQFKNLQDSIAPPQVFIEEDTEPKTYLEFNGRKYGFTDRAPKKLSFDGQVFTQEELLNDEDAMISLIVGESAFIKRIV